DDRRYAGGDQRRRDAAVEVAVAALSGVASVEEHETDAALAQDLARRTKADILDAAAAVVENQVALVVLLELLPGALECLGVVFGFRLSFSLPAVRLEEDAVADEVHHVVLAHRYPAVQAVRRRRPQDIDGHQTGIDQRLEAAADDGFLLV